MLGEVKVDKLSFGLDSVTTETANRIDEVIRRYYGVVVKPKNHDRFHKLKRDVTPTKQLREGYDGFNHNLQMIPLHQFLKFLQEVRSVAGQNLNLYLMHLPVDITVEGDVADYLEVLLNHEYLNGYVATTNATDSYKTVYVAKKKRNPKSKRNQKLKIKFYDKAGELIDRDIANRVLPLKELVDAPELPMDYSTGGDRYGLLLYKMNLLRCEIELREDYLPFHTIDDMIEAIQNGTFQETIKITFNDILCKTVFAQPKKQTSCRTLKQLAVDSAIKSKRNYKLLCYIHDMGRAYNYFKKAKEAYARDNDLVFEELRGKFTH